MSDSQKGSVSFMVVLAAAGIIIYFVTASLVPLKDKLLSSLYPKPQSQAATIGNVTLVKGKLYVDNTIFTPRAINYNPVAIGTDQIDPTAPLGDVPVIAAMGANTIATYTSTKIEWGNYTNAGSGDLFYDNLAKTAQQYNIKLVIGYFSNQAIDWTDPTRVAAVTQQYQGMINKAKTNPSTLMYMIGNETFEKMSNDTQRIAYAKWIGQMVDWTHQNDPNHPVMYADNDQMVAMNWLKNYAPGIDIYGYNNYVWSNATELKSALQIVNSAWPEKPIFLHEWGVDSFDATSWKENQTAQADRIIQMIQIADQVTQATDLPISGHIFFEYTDDWQKLGTPDSQTADAGWPWGCKTPFEAKCNEEYWGLAASAKLNASGTRTLKSAYYALQNYWKAMSTPSPTPSPTISPLPTNVLDTTPPITDFTNPIDGSVVTQNSIVTIQASATDNVLVSKVLFYVDGSLKCTDTYTPYACKWKVPKKSNGTAQIKATSVDSSNNQSSKTITVSIR